MRSYHLLTIILIFAFAQGCATLDWANVRRTDATAFLTEMDDHTADVLDGSDPLDLERCIAIALENNHEVRSADLARRIAKLNRRVAFANFLPALSLNYTYTELDNTPASVIGPLTASVQDRVVRDTALQAQMPIFAPATWFLYALHQRGEEIGEIAADYVRQMIALQVTGLYYQSLATRESHRLLASQRDAATVLTDEIRAFYHEGMVTEAALAQAEVLRMLRENAVEINARALERNLAELLGAMGLAPTAPIQLETSLRLEAPTGALDDWILEALLNHPRLAVADRLVAIEADKTRIAITNFLPALMGFASRSHTSNSFLAYPYVSAVGFSGVMTLFNGFENVNEYRIARTEQEKAFLAREQESLALMLEVINAHISLSDARANLRLANAAATAAEIKLREERAKMNEGLLRPSEMLAAVAAHDEAQVNAATALFQEQVMIAIARNVLGTTYFETKDEENE